MTGRRATKAKRRRGKAEPHVKDRVPLIEHLRELRRRLAYVAITVVVGAGIAYGFEHQIINILLRPSGGQEFIYTSPMGGINFLLTVCLGMGVVLAIPVIVYQVLAFLKPLMGNTTRRFLLTSSIAAGILALAGVAFGYFFGLPSGLHFLLSQFTTDQVQPLLTIQSYTQFVALYLLGSALIFQVPLVVLFINRITPLKPRSLLRYEKHVLVGSIFLALIINPSPSIVDQLFLAVPMFVSYQAAIFLLWRVNRKKRPPRRVQLLREQDAQRQAERLSRPLKPLVPADLPPIAATDVDADLPLPAPTPAPRTAAIAKPRPATAAPAPLTKKPITVAPVGARRNVRARAVQPGNLRRRQVMDLTPSPQANLQLRRQASMGIQ